MIETSSTPTRTNTDPPGVASPAAMRPPSPPWWAGISGRALVSVVVIAGVLIGAPAEARAQRAVLWGDSSCLLERCVEPARPFEPGRSGVDLAAGVDRDRDDDHQASDHVAQE